MLTELLTSILSMAIVAGTPLLLATLGEIYAERSGVLNLGIEGMMMMGASVGFVVVYETKNFLLGFICAALAGGCLALIHGYATITMRGNQIVSGIALAIVGIGLGALIGANYIGKPLDVSLFPIRIPFLCDIPLLGALFSQDVVVYFVLLLSFILWFILFQTRWGLEIRAVGENPSAADAMGINVDMVRYICVFLGGNLAGIAGAYISTVYMGSWSELLTIGKGWIALALVIVALWNPLLAPIAAYLFGFLDVLSIWLQKYGLSPHLLGTIPYIVTIIMLSVSKKLIKKIGYPAALGRPYIREEEALYGL